MTFQVDHATMWFSCDLRDSIAREVCFTGRYEPQETRLLHSLLRPGMTFVDVGANWGYFSLLGSQLVGPEGKVLAIEPDPRLVALLQLNHNKNSLRQLEIIQAAASDEVGQLILSGFREDEGNWGISTLSSVVNAPQFDVNAVAVDDLLDQRGIGKIDLLKMDIEGGEVRALKGMARGIEQARYDRILLELHPPALRASGVSLDEVLHPICSAGYRMCQIDHGQTVTRRVSYKRDPPIEWFLKPPSSEMPTDSWPHVLLIAPGLSIL